MENRKRLYIVSFGDSHEYRMFYDGDEARIQYNPPLSEVERELNDYLKARFHDDKVTYYTEPKVRAVAWEERDRYADYPMLDAKAVEDLKELLATEIRDMNSTAELNDNAPYADAPV